MHLVFLLFNLIALSTATFHLVAQNPMTQDPISGDNTDFVANGFFVIGSSDDSHDNKCSNLEDGHFSVPVSSIFTFQDPAQNSNSGLGLLQTNVFTLGPFCGLADGTQFVNNQDGTFQIVTNGGEDLGSCSPADHDPEECSRTVTNDAGNFTIEFGSVTDLLFCDVDKIPNFCDPAS